MANKKINQLVLKTTIQSTDLFPLGDATTGQLYKKTIAELQAAIGGAVISVNGLVGTVVLDTDDIQELASPTNKYFTDARARAAISLTTTGNSGASTYSSSTGVLNVPTYTLAGLGGITASFLSGGTGITYNSGTGVISYSGTVFTDASIRALVSAGTGLSYNSTTGVFSYSGTVYTDSSVRALISGTAPITYNNTTGAIGITQATTSTNGYLSSTDWNTFNGKQSALTIGNFTEATSSVLTITGGTGAIIGSGLSVQVKLASGSQSGYLSSTDWTTFNSKQNALTNPVTGTGTSGYVAYWNGSGTLTGAAGHFWDNTNGRLGIGTSSPGSLLTLYETTTPKIAFQNSGAVRAAIQADSGSLILNSVTGNDIRFQTDSTTRATITSAGNVGIGTITTLSQLDVRAANQINDSYGLFYLASTNSQAANLGGQISIGGLVNTTSYTVFGAIAGRKESSTSDEYKGYLQFSTLNNSVIERMRITSAGNVGINTVYAPGPNGLGIAIYKNDYPRITFRNSTTGDQATGGFQFYLNGNNFYQESPGAIIFANNANESMRLTSSNNILMGTTTDNGERLYVSGSIRATGSITANSDARLKKNIERIENALEKVGQISGYTYNTIYDEDRHAGVIAQEIDKVLPEIVNKGNDGLMGVEYGNISALLIEAIKDLKQRNEKLEAIVEGLSK